ncbi:beta-1,4-galactosyltransferase 5-like [Ciona intestinalis]
MVRRYKYPKFLSRPRGYVVLLLLSFLCTMYSMLHFIYYKPGRANALLYRYQAMQETVIDYVYYGGIRRQKWQLKQGLASTAAQTIPYLPLNYNYSNFDVCPEKFPEMKGQIYVNMTEIPLSEVNTNFSHIIQHGGSWEPHDCIAAWNVAFLIPFRNRYEHLPILFRHLLPMLIKQRIKFSIFVINQEGDDLFNRALLLNIGFVEAMKIDHSFDCFVFHDVDHIPENDRNYYGCTGMPCLFAEQLDIHGYRLEYEDFFGGVNGVTTQQFKNVNGFSNQFWGWGGEDDDFYTRIRHYGYNVSRPPNNYGKYQSIVNHHTQERQYLGRFSRLKHSVEQNFIDGLNSLHYNKPTIRHYPLFTNISLKLRPDG